eukprot:COSAG01_NODE_17462_length_1149_cov_4.025714_1_plen_66_part_00
MENELVAANVVKDALVERVLTAEEQNIMMYRWAMMMEEELFVADGELARCHRRAENRAGAASPQG